MATVIQNQSACCDLKDVFLGSYQLSVSTWAVAHLGARRQLTRLQLCGFKNPAAQVDLYLDGGAGWTQVSSSNITHSDYGSSCIEALDFSMHSSCEAVGISVGQNPMELELRTWGLLETSQLFVLSLAPACRLPGPFRMVEWCAAELWVQRCLSGYVWHFVNTIFRPHVANRRLEPTADFMHQELTKFVGEMDQETFNEVCVAPGTEGVEQICHTSSHYLKYMPGFAGWKPAAGYRAKIGSIIMFMSAASLEPNIACRKLRTAVSLLMPLHAEFKTAGHTLRIMGRATKELYENGNPSIELLRHAVMPVQATLESTSAGIVALRYIYTYGHQHYLKEGCIAAGHLPDSVYSLTFDSCWAAGPEFHDCCRNYLEQVTLPRWGAPAWMASEVSLSSEVARVFENRSSESTLDDKAHLRCRWNGSDAKDLPTALAFAAAWLQLAVQMRPDVAPRLNQDPMFNNVKTVELQNITNLLDAVEACLRSSFEWPQEFVVLLGIGAAHPLWKLLDRLSLSPVLPVHHEGFEGHSFSNNMLLMAVLPDREEISMNVMHKATTHCPASLKSLLSQVLIRSRESKVFFAEVGGFLGDCVLWAAAHPRMHLLEVEPHGAASQRFAKSVSFLAEEVQERISLRVHALGDQAGWFQMDGGPGAEIEPVEKTEAKWLRADRTTHSMVACHEAGSLEGCMQFQVLEELLNEWLKDAQVHVLRIKANGFEPAILRGLGSWHQKVRWVHADCWKPQLEECLAELSALGLVLEDSWCGFGRDCIAIGRQPSEPPLSSKLH